MVLPAFTIGQGDCPVRDAVRIRRHLIEGEVLPAETDCLKVPTLHQILII
jgi:hypothetical protein